MPSRESITIKILTRHSADFYLLMGPWLANRRVIADLGHVPYDDENKIWIVAIGKSGVVGFVAAVKKTAYVEYCTDFVAPFSRRMGIYSQLFAKRDSLFYDKQIRAMATSFSLPLYI